MGTNLDPERKPSVLASPLLLFVAGVAVIFIVVLLLLR